MKKIVVSSLFAIGFFFLFSFEQTFAIQNIPDGNATWENGYRPSQYDVGAKTHARDVPSFVRTAWERNQIKRGGKYPDIVYNPKNENLFMYDVYSKHLSNNGRGWEIFTQGTGSNREDFFSFDGWSINAGYHHHTRGNQATYIGVVNTRTKERKIYKAMMFPNFSSSAYSMINSDTGERLRRCTNNEYRVALESPIKYKSNGETIPCNMDYNAVGFRAFIPLNDLFPNPNNTDEWEFYIIKNVEGVLVYDKIVLPFNEPAINWGNGELTLKSQLNNDHLIAIDDITIKYRSPNGNFSPNLGTFNKGKTYRRTNQSENWTVVWYQVRDNVQPNATNELRWANSTSWHFGGSIATLSYKPKYATVTIRHLDAKNNNQLIKSETKQVLLNQSYTFSPASRGTFKNKDGNPYVPVPLNQTVTRTITGDTTINFYYKASIPDPSYTIKDPKTSDGRAKGDMQWYLDKDKDDSPSKFVIENNAEIDGEHVDTRNAVHKIHIQYPDDNINDGILNRKEYSFPNPNVLKNGELTFTFEYEYTNHQNVIFKCVDVQFNDCFEWQIDEIKPSWSKEHTEKAQWEVTLPVDHQYGETIPVLNMYEENKKSLRIGRKATLNGHEDDDIEQTESFETFKNNTRMQNLLTQTFFVVDQDIKYESDLNNKLYFLKEEMNFYPYKEFLDNNLRDKYKVENPNPNSSHGDYELPMRVDKKTNSNIHFKLADVFYVTKRTGLQFSLPYEESRTTVINQTAKEEYEAYTNETYDEEVLTKHNNSSILFMNIDGKADLKPQTYYQSKYRLGKLGLSDVILEAYVFHSFNQYLIGGPLDNPVITEVQRSVVEDVTYPHSVTITPKQMKEIRKLSEDRGMLLHSYRATDHYRMYNELKKILPSFDE